MSRWIYSLLLWLVALLLPIKLLWRARLQPEYLAHWQERYGCYAARVQAPLLWLHCVSVGETRAAEPLVNALLQAYPQYQMLITHGTPTGRATSTQLFATAIGQGRLIQAYLPVDVPCLAKRFLRHFQPQWGGLMETELWFHLLAAAKQQGCPVSLLSARLSEKSAKGYAKLGNLTIHGLQQLAWIATQTEADAHRFLALGAKTVTVCGNLKFDVTPPAASAAFGQVLKQWLGANRCVMMAASTREGEEAMILDAAKLAAVLTLLVPRHPQRFSEVEHLLQARGLSYVRRSQVDLQARELAPLPASVQVVLGDSMGEMYGYYAASDFAVMGGSLAPLGGQNLIEAAAMGVPTILGPHLFNFAQVSEAAVAAGAAFKLEDTAQLATAISRLETEPITRGRMSAAAIAFSQAHRGTTQRLMTKIHATLTAKGEHTP